MKFYVTTPIYYSNAKPHIGSAYPTVAADVLARYHKEKGSDVHFLTGVAEHGQKMEKKAKEEGRQPQEFVNETSSYFTDAWQALNIQYSDFIRTTEDRHTKAVTLFFEKLKESGKIYEAEYTGLYCVGHESFIKESELDEGGLCPDHKTKPESVQEKNWFFKLSEYGQVLLDAITSGEFVIEPASRRNEVISFIEQGLEDITISRQNVPWAISIPWDDSQTIYVWLDELFNYCSAIGYGVDEDTFQKWWPADLHIVGKDIIKFHCIIWPALLLAIGEKIPKKVFAHGFFTVNGEKISKSLGNAIDPIELVGEYGADAIRYYLLRDIPFGSDSDFSHERLKERYNADLANGLGNLVSRTLQMVEKFTPSLQVDEKLIPGEVQEYLKVAGQHIEVLAFDKALASIWEVIAWADGVIEDTKPWEMVKAGKENEVEPILGKIVAALSGVAMSLVPLLPDTAQKITEMLQADTLKKPSEPLFSRKD